MKKWMQGVNPKKGALHRALGIPADQGIPTETLHQHQGDNGLMGQRARLALRYRGLADGGMIEGNNTSSTAAHIQSGAKRHENRDTDDLTPAAKSDFRRACRGK